MLAKHRTELVDQRKLHLCTNELDPDPRSTFAHPRPPTTCLHPVAPSGDSVCVCSWRLRADFSRREKGCACSYLLPAVTKFNSNLSPKRGLFAYLPFSWHGIEGAAPLLRECLEDDSAARLPPPTPQHTTYCYPPRMFPSRPPRPFILACLPTSPFSHTDCGSRTCESGLRPRFAHPVPSNPLSCTFSLKNFQRKNEERS